jgi:hypothetical protein
VIEQSKVVAKLEDRVRSLLRDEHPMFQAIGNRQVDRFPLACYEAIAQDSHVPKGVRYLALHCVASKYCLYLDTQGPAEMLGVVSGEMGNSSLKDIVRAIQYVKTSYVHLYKIDASSFDRAEDSARELMTRLPQECQNQQTHRVKGTTLNPLVVGELVADSKSQTMNLPQVPAKRLKPTDEKSPLFVGSLLCIALTAFTATYVVLQNDQSGTVITTVAQKSISSVEPPETVVFQYYKEITNRQYELAWARLPVSLQDNTKVYPKGYDSFVEFFEKSEDIKVNELVTIEGSDTRALLDADVECLSKNGSTLPLLLRFSLGRADKNQEWQIHKIIQNPLKKSQCGISN